jgi:hypothetical protein
MQAVARGTSTAAVTSVLFVVGRPVAIYTVAIDGMTGLRSQPAVAELLIENPAGFDVPVVRVAKA